MTRISNSELVLNSGLAERIEAYGWVRTDPCVLTLEGDGVIWRFALEDEGPQYRSLFDKFGAELIGFEDMVKSVADWYLAIPLLSTPYVVHRVFSIFDECIEANLPEDSPLFRGLHEIRLTENGDEWIIPRLNGGNEDWNGAAKVLSERMFEFWEVLVWPRVSRAMNREAFVEEYYPREKLIPSIDFPNSTSAFKRCFSRIMIGDIDYVRREIAFVSKVAAKPLEWYVQQEMRYEGFLQRWFGPTHRLKEEARKEKDAWEWSAQSLGKILENLDALSQFSR